MTIREIIERLSAYPEYWEVMSGHDFVTDVRDVTRVHRLPELHGGSAVSADVVVVIT